MGRLERASGRDAVRALKALGFTVCRQRGSHVVMKRKTADGEVGCVVPLHDELAVGTLRGVLRQARVTMDEFVERP